MNNNDLNNSSISESAAKILQSSVRLFASNNFNAVSIKEIAAASGVNSALISYYFGGKRNLYQEVLNTQAKIFMELIEKICQLDSTPLNKIHLFVNEIIKLQEAHPYCINLIYRELLAPQPMFESFVKNKLYKVHQFLTELIAEAIEAQEISAKMQPTHVAFTLESIIMFFYLTHSEVRDLGNFAAGQESEYLNQTLNTYLASLK